MTLFKEVSTVIFALSTLDRLLKVQAATIHLIKMNPSIHCLMHTASHRKTVNPISWVDAGPTYGYIFN